MIRLEGSCTGGAECAPLAKRTHGQLAGGRYSYPCSVLELPESPDGYLAEHTTARKRAARARRLGYRFDRIDRALYVDDVYAINTSAPERQGRPMSDAYLQRPDFSPLPDYACARHAINTYGVLDDRGRLRAYTWIYRVGELVMVSSILGHADHLAGDIMYLLATETIAAELEHGHGVAFYNMHDSGTEGLRYFKERLGFTPAHVDWSLA